MKEFKSEKAALDAIQQANKEMIRSKSQRKNEINKLNGQDDGLDTVPTKGSPVKKKDPWNGRVQSSIPKEREPRKLYKPKKVLPGITPGTTTKHHP